MHYLIIEGGGFKTAFTAGILDAFIINRYDPFDGIVGVSGGAVALSYFLSKQYRQMLASLRYLATDPQFLNYRRTLGKEGYMNIDALGRVSQEVVPFDILKAYKKVRHRDVRIVATRRDHGTPEYFVPTPDLWIDQVIASCTLPLVTKGKHIIDGVDYFDGGWSDGLPVRWAADAGATQMTVIRTWPSHSTSSQSWTDYFASYYFKDLPGLSAAFQKNYQWYNESIDFLNAPPSHIEVTQLSPKKELKSGTYRYTKRTIMHDYRYGVDMGLRYLAGID